MGIDEIKSNANAPPRRQGRQEEEKRSDWISDLLVLPHLLNLFSPHSLGALGVLAAVFFRRACVFSAVNSLSESRPAVFLDRDGVLNRTAVRDGVPHPPNSVAEVEILPGVDEALKRLAALGIPLIVVTNQPDVARGTQTKAAVESINEYLRERLPLTAFYVCYHDTPDNCTCRKPKPGLILDAAAAYNIDLRRSFLVGDRWSDVAAGQAAGCETLLIDLPYSKGDRCSPGHRVRDLGEAAEIIVRMFAGRDKVV
jgi:D-glycero-D-manno-heptose 1,7-bisphosphate phosphatase